MKKLKQIEIDFLNENYPHRWVDAMLEPEKQDKCLSFIERHSIYGLTYTEVFFSPDGFILYSNGIEERLFTIQNSIFPSVPVRDKDADGDWQKWLSTAKIVKELK